MGWKLFLWHLVAHGDPELYDFGNGQNTDMKLSCLARQEEKQAANDCSTVCMVCSL